MKPTPEMIDRLTRELVDKGKLIEAGWVGLRLMSVPPEASDTQVNEMRKAFFAGAQHLYASILGMLEPDAEPTNKDLERMGLIDAELQLFIKTLTAHEARRA